MDQGVQMKEYQRDDRIVPSLIELETYLADVRRVIKDEHALGLSVLDFEEMYDKHYSVDDVRPQSDAIDVMNDLAEWTNHLRRQTKESQTPMEAFLAASPASEPLAFYAGSTMAAMVLQGGAFQHVNTRARMRRLVGAHPTAFVREHCEGGAEEGASSRASKVASNPLRKTTLQTGDAKGIRVNEGKRSDAKPH